MPFGVCCGLLRRAKSSYRTRYRRGRTAQTMHLMATRWFQAISKINLFLGVARSGEVAIDLKRHVSCVDNPDRFDTAVLVWRAERRVGVPTVPCRVRLVVRDYEYMGHDCLKANTMLFAYALATTASGLLPPGQGRWSRDSAGQNRPRGHWDRRLKGRLPHAGGALANRIRSLATWYQVE